jgi:hypothetical protein
MPQAPGRSLQWFTSRLALTLGLNDCSCCDSGLNRSLVPRPEGNFRLRHGGCIAMVTEGGLEVLAGLDFTRRAATSMVKVPP